MKQKISVVSRPSEYPETSHEIKLIFCEYWKDVPEGDLSGAEIYFVKSDAPDCPEAPPAFKEALTRLDATKQEVTQLQKRIEQVITELYATQERIVAYEKKRYDDEIRINNLMRSNRALRKRLEHRPQKHKQKKRRIESC